MTTSVLDRIREPSDLHELDLPQLAELAESVRREIIRTMAANGGHLATNLGTVELSIALHRCFDSPRDKIVWDVGNQCYTHKMLTGRRSRFHTIRKAGGLSGFVHRLESPHDHFTSGHAGTALSCALGLAAARQRLKQDHAVVAVVGDGALTSGLSYEALNNLSALRSQFLLILNDNSFAISPNRGGVASALEQARAKILEGTFFEDLGLPYFGPVDGHDLPLLLRVFEQVREVDHPVVIHVLTRKGKGYRPAEADPERFHGVSPFDPSSGMSLSRSKAPTYSQLFGEEMVRLGEEDDRIIAITAAMTVGTG
ncbi:MAG: 1-deoxy-D-xylulose-5-phosphate synthase, partial [Planctomycetota bacterium]